MEETPQNPDPAPIPNFLPAAVLVTLFVCPVIGIYAMYLGCKSDKCLEEDRRDDARELAEKVRKWLIASIPVGVLSYVLLWSYCF